MRLWESSWRWGWWNRLAASKSEEGGENKWVGRGVSGLQHTQLENGPRAGPSQSSLGCWESNILSHVAPKRILKNSVLCTFLSWHLKVFTININSCKSIILGILWNLTFWNKSVISFYNVPNDSKSHRGLNTVIHLKNTQASYSLIIRNSTLFLLELIVPFYFSTSFYPNIIYIYHWSLFLLITWSYFSASVCVCIKLNFFW